MSNYMDFSSDNINVFEMVFDESGSMYDDEYNVINGWKMFRKSFDNFPEAASIAVAISKFSDRFEPGEFQSVKNLSFDYSTDGSTALYYSIVEGANHLMKYIQKVAEKKGIIPKATFIVFSDGKPCQDPGNRSDARRAIERLNMAGVTTVFVAFGDAISSKFGKNMGFVSTIDVNTGEELKNFLGVELSKSCKEQSKSMKSLGANFFSQATGNQSKSKYSQTTRQVLDDTSWIDEI